MFNFLRRLISRHRGGKLGDDILIAIASGKFKIPDEPLIENAKIQHGCLTSFVGKNKESGGNEI